ncbi:hypothetical protein [Lactiplantibacillus argentoratensis]|nr:hypothetical protein [Lactiplantibacillus argentoratensis]
MLNEVESAETILLIKKIAIRKQPGRKQQLADHSQVVFIDV